MLSRLRVWAGLAHVLGAARGMAACRGCGVEIQHRAADGVGFLPKERMDAYVEALHRYENREVYDTTPATPEPVLATPSGPDDGSYFAMNPDADASPARVPTMPKLPVCARCHMLRGNRSVSRAAAPTQPLPGNALLVVVADMLDYPNSLHPGLMTLREGGHSVIIAANKADLLPCDLQKERDRIRGWVRKEGAMYGVTHADAVHLISARTGWGLKKLFQTVYERCQSSGAVAGIVGCTSAGKSSIVNSLLKSSTGDEKVTESVWPGTTLAAIPFDLRLRDEQPYLARAKPEGARPGAVRLFDLPGVPRPDHMAGLLDMRELAMISSHKTILPETHIVRLGQSVFFGGLARIDYIEGPPGALFTVCMAPKVTVHVTSTLRADAVHARHAGTDLLCPPVGGPDRMKLLPPLEPLTFDFEATDDRVSQYDLVLGPLGFVSFTCRGNIKIKAYTPQGQGMHLREALLPLAVQQRGRRHGQTFDQRSRS
eukprot:m.240885 g.240885  ORF g.240885 m.240885 type:complete len:485 (+) comp13746_c0_seq1:1090-2544(+)